MTPVAKRALIVEDNPDGRVALHELLTEWGYDVADAEDEERAIALAGTQHRDVLVIDLGFRGWDSLSIIKRIKADDERVFVVVFTGWAHLRAAARAAGADAYVIKPDVDALQRLLDRATAPTPEVTQRKDRAS